jgi:hypothetical protein
LTTNATDEKENVIAAIVGGGIDRYTHDGQKDGGGIHGRLILARLNEDGLLEACLTPAELRAILAESPDFYREYFDGLRLCAWKDFDGHSVQYLFQNGDRVEVGRWWIDLNFNATFVAGLYRALRPTF